MNGTTLPPRPIPTLGSRPVPPPCPSGTAMLFLYRSTARRAGPIERGSALIDAHPHPLSGGATDDSLQGGQRSTCRTVQCGVVGGAWVIRPALWLGRWALAARQSKVLAWYRQYN